MSKRNSKSSNASSVVVVRCAALKMGAFFSSCSKLCNEWSLMSVRRAEAELRWFKRNRESTGTMRESTETGLTAGDHVLVTAILSAVFIVALVYLLVLGQPFRFRRLERARTPSSTATSASWVQGPSKTRLLPGFLSTVRYNAGSNTSTVADVDSAATGDATPEGIVHCEILKHSRTHEPVFRCSMDPEYNGNTLSHCCQSPDPTAVHSFADEFPQPLFNHSLFPETLPGIYSHLCDAAVVGEQDLFTTT